MIVLYILLAILIFGALIFIHELGHFLAARACKVTVREFAIGMGPKIVSICPGKKRAEKKKRLEEGEDAAIENEFAVDPRPPKPMSGDEEVTTEEATKPSEPVYTTYSLRALPIGGFVSMEGENEDSNDPNAFHKKNAAQRMLILVAGATMNLILGVILMFVLVCNSTFVTTAIWYNHDGENANIVYESEEQGLQNKDKILKIGNTRVHTGYEISYEIMMQGNKPVDVTFERKTVDENGNEKTEILVKTIQFPVATESGTEVGVQDFGFYAYSDETVTLWDRIDATFWRSVSTVKMVWDSLGGLFNGRLSVQSVSGPVGVTEVIVDAAKANWQQLLYIVTVITINLGVMNLLPFPALDGGQLLICLIETVIRRKLPEKVKGIINFVGLAILMVLMFAIACKDIVGLIGRLINRS